MKNYYGYIGTREPFGTDRRVLFEARNDRKASIKFKRWLGAQPGRLFRFTNFYDNSTFRRVDV